ncbi:MAG: trimeric intracellular cation channel family protein [Trebonia sp.]
MRLVGPLALIGGQAGGLPAALQGFDPTLILVLNLVGTFVFGISGGLAAVRVKLDLFGAIVLAAVVGLFGGIIRDVLIGIPPSTFRDWRYLAVVGIAGLVTAFALPLVNRLQRPIATADAAGLALFCVTGSATALAHRLGPAEAVILGAITGIGGGMVRDVLVREIPEVLRGGLYAVPALVGAGIVVAAFKLGDHSVLFPIVGAVVCFTLRMVGLRYGLGLPRADTVAIKHIPGPLDRNKMGDQRRARAESQDAEPRDTTIKDVPPRSGL